MTAPLTIINSERPQQITNTAEINITGSAGTSPTQVYDFGAGTQATLGGEPLSGILVVSQGSHGSEGGDQGHRDGGLAQGGMLTTSGSVTLDLSNTTPSGMVTGVGVSSVGGDGYSQVEGGSNDDGGNGGQGGSTTLVNSSTVTISGGNLANGVMGALVETKGGNGGVGDYWHPIDSWGGNGGSTQAIEMDNYADVTLGTSSDNLQGGTRAWGVVAQAVGGDGGIMAKGEEPWGNGGGTGNVRFLSTGNVNVFLSSNADTPDGVVGLLARSVGGTGADTNYEGDNGGNGGNAAGAQLTAGQSSLSAVTNINVGVAQAVTGLSAGVLVQSLGGKGGDQQWNNATGGDGGSAGAVSADLYWVNLNTTGDDVMGVVAQSVGGNGGTDSMDSNRTDGGNGGQAGTASVTLTSKGNQAGQQTSVSTNGLNAIGVLAQSIGGQGGGAVKDAGQGRDGAEADITADANSQVTTTQDFSIGMLAQSLGGGGGTGQDFASSLPGSPGNGGRGGNGDDATINSSATIQTQGQHAHGILAQSIGGSGGAGAMADGVIALGGDGGAGGFGGTVTLTHSGNITTGGFGSIGVIGQSIGGGGGSAGSATGLFSVGGSAESGADTSGWAPNPGGQVTVTNNGAIKTTGDGAAALIGQSIGGGGGNGASAAGLTAVGGSGGAGGDGGSVTVNANGTHMTSGAYSYGAVAQSIGGGGGNGGSVMALSAAGVTPTIGGSGGRGGASGTAQLNISNANGQAATVSTTGDGATGLIAQSIGGGGGNGGSASQLAVGVPVSLAIGGAGGSGGSASTSNVQTTGAQITTAGTSAPGMLAQSIGGGGGSGGDAHAYDANVGVSVGIALGGGGGVAGDGAKVTVGLTDTLLSTAGIDLNAPPAWPLATPFSQVTDSYGILAQSIGGGGGHGGSAVAGSLAAAAPTPDGPSFAISTSIAVGAAGGAGGAGGEVDVTLSGNSAIFTGGQGSHGVLTQSIAGGGGAAGDSKALSRTVALEDQSIAVNVEVAVGGNGGAAGNASTVNLTLNDAASVTTYSDYSNALMGQSIGGGGGNAGVGSTSSGGIAQGKTITVGVGVGGKGGDGGNGGTAETTLSNDSILTTYGSGSRGVLLQSVGGGGGASQGVTVDLGIPVSWSNGSGGGSAADVGDDPNGGSGGTTKFAATVNVSVGRSGAGGGDGGAVTATANGQIATQGGDADGIVLQSIGGGGGLGGSAGSDASSGPTSYPSAPDDLNSPIDPNNPPTPPDTDLGSYGVSVAVGGAGGASGAGGQATLNYGGAISTNGDHADGIVVQSIGGGGGVGGAATAKGAGGVSQLSVVVGGGGGVGGDSGNINLNLSGNADYSRGVISTSGDASYGLLAQTIGGGGGQGAAATDTITSDSLQKPSLVVGTGGGGGGGGDAGFIDMSAANSAIRVVTAGADSHGIVLQSIGGGGGVAAISGASLSGTVNNPQLNLQIGGGDRGTSEGGGDGGDIEVDSWVSSQTSGDRAFGFVAQSIANSGGIASAGAGANIQSASLVSGLSSYASGSQSGEVNIILGSNRASTDDSYISTSGRGAHGVVLQSIAGGGGIAGDSGNGPLSLGWSDGSAALMEGLHSGKITFTLNADGNGGIFTKGENAHGIIAQSLAAAGGLGGNSAGSFAGAVNQSQSQQEGYSDGIAMSLNGPVQVTGANAWSVFAQTYGNLKTLSQDATMVDITVSDLMLGGAVVTDASGASSHTGGGIWIDSASPLGLAINNTVTINTGAVVDGLKGEAAIKQTGVGTLQVQNHGTLNGDVLGANSSTAQAITVSNYGVLSGADLIQGHIDNQGQVFIGKTAQSRELLVTGDFTQGSQGVLHVAADFLAHTTDLLRVGGRAQLDGKIQVAAETLMPNRELTVLQAGTLAPGAQVQGASELFTYSTRQSGGTLAISADKARFNEISSSYAVGSNLSAVGQHLQDIWEQGGSEALSSLYAQLDRSAAEGGAGYASALSDLSLGASAAPAALATGAVKGFADNLFSCPWFAGANAVTTDGSCVWGRVATKTTHLGDNNGTAATRTRATSYQFGGQRRIAPDWMLGVAAAYENSSTNGDDGRLHIKGDAAYLGAVLKYETGPWTLGGSLYGSYGSYDSTRKIGLANTEADSKYKVWTIGQQLRASYMKGAESSYVKPFVTLDLIYTRMPSYQEKGAGALNLNVNSADRFTAVLTPGVEVGGRVDLSSGYILRPYASVGLALSSTDKWKTNAHLAGRAATGTEFQTTLETGRVYGSLSAGVQLTSRKGFDMQLQYDGVLSNRAHSSSGSIKANWRF
ncbi:hypothetical protein [Mesopusillimonas faecipullorum]